MPQHSSPTSRGHKIPSTSGGRPSAMDGLSLASPTDARPLVVSRRGALALAGLSVLGLGLLGVDSRLAHAEPSASQETIDQLADAQTRYDDARAQLEQMGSTLEALGLQIAETEDNIDQTQTQIDQTQAQIDQRQVELTSKQDDLARRIVADYKAGPVDLLSVLLSSSSLEQLVSNVYYMDKANEADRQSVDEVTALKEGLESTRSSLEDQQLSLQTLQAQLSQQQTDVEAQLEAQQELLDGLDQEVKDLMAQEQAEIEASAEAERQAAIEAAQQAAAEQGGASGSGTVADVSGDLRTDLVSYACSLIGTPYVWGGTYPDDGGTDCSGLMQWSFAQCGYHIPRTTYDQYPACVAAGHAFNDTSLLQPGDLVFFNGNEHVGMYIGSGNIVHDPHPGDVVKISPLSYFTSIYGCGFPIA